MEMVLPYDRDATPAVLAAYGETLESQPDTGSPNPQIMWEFWELQLRGRQCAQAEGTPARSASGQLIQNSLLEVKLELLETTAAPTLRSRAHPRRTEACRTIHHGRALTRGVLSRLAGVDGRRAADAQRILDDFSRAADAYDVSGAPDLRLTEADDGAILIEWTFADRRLGFSLEQQPGDSGWYFVLSNGSTERFEAGTLDQLEMRRLVEMMLTT